jgi:hypothetical protein
VPSWLETERKVIEGFFRFSPSHARTVGDHRFDGVVGDVSRTSIRARILEVETHLGELAEVSGLDRDREIDRRALVAQLQAAHFDLAELRSPFTNPLFYVGAGSELDMSPYVQRAYAPLPERVQTMTRHLEGLPDFLESARSNLEADLPRPHLEIGIEAAEGQRDYLLQEVRAIAAEDREAGEIIDRAAKDLGAFAQFLKDRIPRAHDDYALGEQRFLSYLKGRELIEHDLKTLEKMIEHDLRRNTERLKEVADQVKPKAGVEAAVASIQDDHPTRESMIRDVEGMLESIRSFIIARDLVSVPSETRCLVRATPSFYSYITAALDSAGPLETVATESYYYVTVPGPDWGEQRSEEWLRTLNYAILRNTSIHEAYPGHYLQSLHERLANSLTRQVFWVQSTGEGYAHYAEQMMLEEHFSEDPRHELAQLLDALLRDCRFKVSIGLHCHVMPMEDAVQTMMGNAFLSRLPAQREAMRGAWDPLYLNYTLGKLLIYELRQKVQARPGYSLKGFHDSFLRCGNIPIPLIGQLIL